jgi:hypothetical protein
VRGGEILGRDCRPFSSSSASIAAGIQRSWGDICEGRAGVRGGQPYGGGSWMRSSWAWEECRLFHCFFSFHLGL